MNQKGLPIATPKLLNPDETCSDVTFYAVALALVVITFIDEMVRWYNAVLLFCIYICYILFMKFNEQLERWVRYIMVYSMFFVLRNHEQVAFHVCQI